MTESPVSTSVSRSAGPGVAAVERRLREVLRSEVEFIELIGEDLVAAGGKRIRPQVTLLAAAALGQPGDDPAALDLAVCTELLHSASLLHDDLIDDAETRRGQEAAFRRYGNVVSVMSGDFMLSRLLTLLADLPHSPRLTRVFGQTASVVCEGEVLQFQVAAYGNYSMEQYWRIIYGKTAALLELAAEAPALMLDSPRELREALRTYGRELGMAFQIRDDLLDLFGTEAQLGKPVGSDLREGKATLPVLHLLDLPAAEVGGEIRALLLRRAADPGDVARVQALAAQYGSEAASRQEVARRIEVACGALAPLPDSAAKQDLIRLAQSLHA